MAFCMANGGNTVAFKHSLKSELEARGWGILELRTALKAEGCEVSETTVVRWLDGSREPRYEHVEGLKKVFGSIDAFMDDTPANTRTH